MTNKDQTEGRAKTGKGKIKEGAGKLVGNEKLESEGKLDQVKGKTQSKYGDLKDDVANE